MANRVVKCSIKHFDTDSSSFNRGGFDAAPATIHPEPPKVIPKVVAVDKGKSIGELTDVELRLMSIRLEKELELQEKIRRLRINAGEMSEYDSFVPEPINTVTPIDQLYHHGILGMKWGVRRFQRKDGTRTPAGKKRYGDNDQQDGSSQKKATSEDAAIAKKYKEKGVDALTNDELRKLNERLRLEEDYKRLTPQTVQKGESIVKSALKKAGEQALQDVAKGIFVGSAKMLIKQISPEMGKVGFGIQPEDKKKGN